MIIISLYNPLLLTHFPCFVSQLELPSRGTVGPDGARTPGGAAAGPRRRRRGGPTEGPARRYWGGGLDPKAVG